WALPLDGGPGDRRRADPGLHSTACAALKRNIHFHSQRRSPTTPPNNDGFNHEYATINGIRYHYVREGSGPPLMLVHGWPGFYYDWHLNIRSLAEHFEVVAPDMRGYAYTEKPDLPPEEGYTPAVFADDIAALLDHLG